MIHFPDSTYILFAIALVLAVFMLIRINHIGKIMMKADSALYEYERAKQVSFCHFSVLKTFYEILPAIAHWDIKFVFKDADDYEEVKEYIK